MQNAARSGSSHLMRASHACWLAPPYRPSRQKPGDRGSPGFGWTCTKKAARRLTLPSERRPGSPSGGVLPRSEWICVAHAMSGATRLCQHERGRCCRIPHLPSAAACAAPLLRSGTIPGLGGSQRHGRSSGASAWRVAHRNLTSPPEAQREPHPCGGCPTLGV